MAKTKEMNPLNALALMEGLAQEAYEGQTFDAASYLYENCQTLLMTGAGRVARAVEALLFGSDE